MTHLNPDGESLPEWERAAEGVLARPGIVVLLGASDSGKTTLAHIFTDRWRAAGRTVGLVDADIGQSSAFPSPRGSLVEAMPPGGASGKIGSANIWPLLAVVCVTGGC